MNEFRKPIYKGRVVNIESASVELPNGEILDMEVVRHPGGAAVVALDENENVCLLKQYRPVFQQWLWEVPAGKIDNQEPPLETARRELLEEAGLRADTWRDLGVILSSPGIFSERIHLYLATQLTRQAPRAELHEVYEIHWLPLRKAVASGLSGDIQDAKTVIALSRALAHTQAAQ